MNANQFTWFVVIVSCLTASIRALAVEPVIVANVPIRAEDKRQSIRTQRAVLEANYLRAETNCYTRFAVSDCLHEARAKRRVVMDELRRQELELNDLDRQHKAAEALDRIQDKVSPARQQEAVQQQRQAVQAQQEKQKRADEKREAVSVPKTVVQSTRQPTGASSSAADSLIQTQRHLEKLQEAKQHRLDKEKSLDENKGSVAKPLPIPPGF